MKKSKKIEIDGTYAQKYVKLFEDEQKEFGTRVAINNLIWNLASEMMRKAGVKRVTTTYFKDRNGK